MRYISFKQNLPALAFTLAGTLDWFVIGMALATVTVRSPQLIARVNPAGAAAAAVGLVIVMGVLELPWGVIAYDANPTAGGSITAHLFYGAIGLMFVLAATSAELRRAGVVPYLLRNRAAIWLGTISYGIYLWHVPPVIGAVTQITGRGVAAGQQRRTVGGRRRRHDGRRVAQLGAAQRPIVRSRLIGARAGRRRRQAEQRTLGERGCEWDAGTSTAAAGPACWSRRSSGWASAGRRRARRRRPAAHPGRWPATSR